MDGQSQQSRTSSDWVVPEVSDDRASMASLNTEMNPLENSGTLVINPGGRTRFIGPSASSQYHRESPNAPDRSTFQSELSLGGFVPLNRPTSAMYGQLSLELPPESDARDLVERYYRLIAWTGTPVLHEDMLKIVQAIYASIPDVPPGQDLRLALHQLSLLYVVMALGQLANMEVPPNDPESKRLFALAQQCLFSGSFLVYNTLSCVQSLSLLAKFAAYSDIPGGWDIGWQIRGIASRVMIAMGLHRDGAEWGLPDKELNDRRRVFWEAHSSEIFMVGAATSHASSGNAGRLLCLPSSGSIPPFAKETSEDLRVGFWTNRYVLNGHHTRMWQKFGGPCECEWVDLAARVLTILRSRAFEAELPLQLRCRAALRAMVSVYHNTGDAEDASLPPSRRDVCLTFQQHTLSLGFGETVFSLLLPYFIDAIYNNAADPTVSPYAEAYLAVIERSSMLIVTVQSLYTLFPLIATRHWYFWLHAYSAAVCMATVCIVTPNSPLVELCMSFLETAINLFSAAQDALPQRVAKRNLDFLKRLRDHAIAKTASGGADFDGPVEVTSEASPTATAQHLEVIGWRTRLIQLGITSGHAMSLPSSRPRSRAKGSDVPLHTIMPDMASSFGTSSAFVNSPEHPPLHLPGISSPDILHQLLNENIGHSLPSLTDENFSLDLGRLFAFSVPERDNRD
ncbi:hypothetical protein I317_06081 [Kwoniella heveanensis CBS 569]|nr:hypothetical protein I317_06081 [Kwoniella heveanensis CBS 569]